MSRKLVAAGVVVVVLGIIGMSSTFVIREQDQGVVLAFGKFVRVEQKPGLHFKAPWPFQEVRYYDKRVLDFEADLGEINTQDQKQTVVDTYARYQIVDPLKFYQQAGTVELFESRRDEAPLNSTIKSTVREAFTRVDLATLLTAKRAEVMRNITERAHQELERFGVKVLDVRLKRIDLPAQNREAVQLRMETRRRQEAIGIRAEGDKESQSIRAEADKKVRVIRAGAEQKANILRGEGEGKAQEIYNNAFGQDKDFFEFWQCMQTVRDGINTGTRFVGVPSADTMFQLCRTSGTGQSTEPRRAER